MADAKFSLSLVRSLVCYALGAEISTPSEIFLPPLKMESTPNEKNPGHASEWV